MLQAACFSNKISCLGKPDDDLHREINYDLCHCIDLIKLGIVLETMVKEAGLHPDLATAYKAQAEALLAVMRSENNRLHGF